ncbi:hypothetical protein CEXT_107851 [Caerostris extrusa]|uniref:Uncharacterized protein n=1 Tax=Caerostris extrusa TaxID=172846 RepID=A0AAV4PSA4_CAEEX|nr:hypothetical protein CEXT_107851 [Caerostris extrusa]
MEIISDIILKDTNCSSGVNDIEIDYALSFMAADGSAIKEVKERSLFLPDDTLRARCRMWRNEDKTTENGQSYAHTRIGVEARFAVWNIEKFSHLEPYKAITFR